VANGSADWGLVRDVAYSALKTRPRCNSMNDKECNTRIALVPPVILNIHRFPRSQRC